VRRLLESASPVVGVTDVPDPRVRRAAKTHSVTSSNSPGLAADALREALAAVPGEGVELAELCTLAGGLGYSTYTSCLASRSNGDIDVAFVRDFGAGAPALIAFPRAAQDTGPLANDPLAYQKALVLARDLVPDVRDFARRSLPEHMVPSSFATLDRLPLTPNGKLDLRSLPDVSAVPAPVGRAPISETEATLCALFAEVLHRDEVGRDDSFFDFGGHSLAAIRLLNRINSTFGAVISLRDFFARPNPADTAAYLNPTPGGPP
jgi:acyl carrier protein